MIDGLATSSFTFGGRLGADVQFKGTPFVVGAFVDYARGKAEFDADVRMPFDKGKTSALVNVLNLGVEPNWGVGGRAGVVLYNSALLYGGYMYRWADVEAGGLGLKAFDRDLVSVKRDLHGHVLLAGLEVPITERITLGLEYQYTRYDTVNLLPVDCCKGAEGTRLDLDAENHAFMARLTLRAPMTALPGLAVTSPTN